MNDERGGKMMAKDAVLMKTRRLRWVLALVATGTLLNAAVGRADADHRNAAHAAPQTVAHAGHQHGAMPAAKPGEYARSVQTYSVPDITLVDRYAKAVRLRDILAVDEPVMLNFIFTTCTAICPVMTSIFARVPGELGANGGKLRLVSISIDPENDTPQQLGAYAKKFGAGPNWQFLTGTVEDITAVQRAFDNYRGDKMSHEPLTLLRAAPGKPWVRIEGFASPEELAREYQKVALK